MSEVLPRHILYGFIILVFVLMGGTALIHYLGVQQPSLLDDDRYSEFQSALGSANESLISNVGSVQAQTESKAGSPGAFGWLSALVGNGWSVIVQLYDTFSFGTTAFTSLGGVLGLPGWITTTLLLFITVVIAVSIISAIFQKDV